MSTTQETISSSLSPTTTRIGPWVAPCCGPTLRYMRPASSLAGGRCHSSGLKRSVSCQASACCGGIASGPSSVPREGDSLRSGWPSHQGGLRMR